MEMQLGLDLMVREEGKVGFVNLSKPSQTLQEEFYWKEWYKYVRGLGLQVKLSQKIRAIKIHIWQEGDKSKTGVWNTKQVFVRVS